MRTSLRCFALVLGIGWAFVTVGCDDNNTIDAGLDADVTADAMSDSSGPTFPDGSVLCTEDAECDDGVGCTADRCGMAGYCIFAADPSVCDDGVFCNGVERCDLQEGCGAGARETCNDRDVCTIDRCNEETRSCDHFPRDLDGDGDPDFFCEGGGDCDDRNPARNSLNTEICEDMVDNDCDEMVDESTCGRPAYDTCDDALDVSAGGFFTVNIAGAAHDYTLGCGPSMASDLVASFTLTETRSVSIEARGDLSSAVVSLRSTCDDVASEVDCRSGYPAMLERRALEAGTYYLVITSFRAGEVELNVSFGEPTEPATNETCDAPIDISAGGRFTGSFVEVANDITSSCSVGAAPDLVYSFTTTEERDLVVTLQTATSDSVAFSIRSTCADDTTELRCAYGRPAAGRVHQLPAGTYYLVVEGPSFRSPDFTLDVEFASPTPAPAGDVCSTAIPVTLGTPLSGTLLDKQDDIEVSCGFRYRDAVYSFELTEPADVTIDYDTGSYANISLRTTCEDGASQLRCTTGSPVTQRMRGLDAGTYYLILESSRGSTFSLNVNATSPPATIVDVAGNEDCTSAYMVPDTGGLFRGNTSMMVGDLGTSMCGGSAGAPDAVFALELSSSKRVIANLSGSSFDTVLHAHRTTCTSMAERYCDDDGGEGSTSQIDTTLTAGTWFFVVDGFGSATSGEYVIEFVISDS